MTKGSSYNDFVSHYTDYHLAHPSQRAGQAFCNALSELRPDLVDKLMAANLDPFYAVTNMGSHVRDAFAFVRDHWDD